MASVRISGNWRNPGKEEWGGAFPVDKEGKVERGLDLPAGVYEAIENGIQQGAVEGQIALEGGSRVKWFLDRS